MKPSQIIKKLTSARNTKGKVILVINTASKYGCTGQYEGLEKFYSNYKDQRLLVLGFPSNDFSTQEPGSSKETAEFCRAIFSVTFPMFAKTNGTPKNVPHILC
ncbi:MAG: hypothetical protein COC09_02525 [Gammaproteobacteria bacterium]|nr:hypothetical protein [Gammaproteobacteria bacterium]PCH64477.1 MAG: hypothetical protein COC09_02525 [Gammaproteobacteria bacterium]